MTAAKKKTKPLSVSQTRPSGLVENLRQGFFSTRLYDWVLGATGPDRLRGAPDDHWPGDPDNGRALIEGRFGFAGETLRFDDQAWRDDWGDPLAREKLEGFTWLRDLRAVGNEAALAIARDRVSSWISHHPSWDAFSWRPDIIGQRLSSWIANLPFYCPEPQSEFRNRLLVSCARQEKHLSRVIGSTGNDWKRFAALKGFIYCGVCLPGLESQLDQGLELLEAEIQAQIMADGGHRERSPSIHLQVLRHLVDIRDILILGQVEQPESLQGAIDRMAPLLRAFRHADGGLALFNDSQAERAELIDLVLRQTGVTAKAASSAPHIGFQRLQAAKTIVLMDVGPPPPKGADKHAHAGQLSFEMSSGRERIIVNCGARPDQDPDWRTALRATAAHSTVVLNDTNAMAFDAKGGVAQRPLEVTAQRVEEEGSSLVTASHDGYRDVFGAIVTRLIYLSEDGTSLRGEDRVVGTPGQAIAVRFHLHPRVSVSVIEDGTGALLKTARHQGWRFACRGGGLAIEDSVYLGDSGVTQKTKQLVLTTKTKTDQTAVHWAFQKTN